MKNSKIKISLFLLVFMIGLQCLAQQIPDKPNPPRLVNDYCGILSRQENQLLEQQLRAYNDSTSTQIAVVIVNDLQGTTAADFSYQLGEKWGVGTEKNNGIVILVKPKNDTKGEVFISVGYGLEHLVTDAMAKRIVETVMIPAFKNNDYYSGIYNATEIIIDLCSGSYKGDLESSEDDIFILVFFIFMMCIMIILISIKGKAGRTYTSGKDDSSIWRALFWTSVFSNSRRHNHHNDYWGGFSGGSGGFGGGGFGGFGGGSFGGGGAGGSW